MNASSSANLPGQQSKVGSKLLIVSAAKIPNSTFSNRSSQFVSRVGLTIQEEIDLACEFMKTGDGSLFGPIRRTKILHTTALISPTSMYPSPLFSVPKSAFFREGKTSGVEVGFRAPSKSNQSINPAIITRPLAQTSVSQHPVLLTAASSTPSSISLNSNPSNSLLSFNSQVLPSSQQNYTSPTPSDYLPPLHVSAAPSIKRPVKHIFDFERLHNIVLIQKANNPETKHIHWVEVAQEYGHNVESSQCAIVWHNRVKRFQKALDEAERVETVRDKEVSSL